MEFSFSDDQRSIADLAADVFSAHGSDARIRALHQAGYPYDSDLWQALRQTGLTGLLIPEACGGSGLGAIELALALEQQGRNLCPVPYWQHQVAASAVLEFGSPDAVDDRGRIADGSRIVSIAVEAIGRKSLVGRAARGRWTIDGVVSAVALGPEVDDVLIPVSTDEGERWFVVPTATPSLVRSAGAATHGQRVVDLSFEGVERPGDSDITLQPDPGWIANRARLCIAACQLGVLNEGLRRTAAYCTERHQFGRPIGSFQAVTTRIADAYIEVELLRSAVWQLAWRLDAGEPGQSASLTAKYQASQAGHIVGHTIQHYHGGIGSDLTYPIHRFFLWAKALEFSSGSAEDQLERLGDEVPERIDDEEASSWPRNEPGASRMSWSEKSSRS